MNSPAFDLMVNFIESVTPAVVIVGNLSDGFTVYGPYESFDEAVAGCAEFQDAETWVTGLYNPVDSDDPINSI